MESMQVGKEVVGRYNRNNTQTAVTNRQVYK